jgi:hypothetical protein
MNGIIGRASVSDNRDASVTPGHEAVAGDRESTRHPATRPGDPTGGLRMPAKENSMQLPTRLARRISAAAAAITLLASLGSSGALAGGPPSLGFYVDDVRYRTVGTPTDFFGTGAPDFTFDKIYNLGTGINVGEAKPGDRDFNGGRWQVYVVTWAQGVTPVQYTNVEQIYAAEDQGLLTIGATPVKEFFCNVAPVPGSKAAH